MEDRIHAPGEHIGAYAVTKHLATGGFCALYAARALAPGEHRDPNRTVALKVCRYDPRSLSPEEQTRHNDRLGREFELLKALPHPGIVRVHERHFHEGLSFYAMELLEGPTLARWMAAEPRSFLELLRVFQGLAGALACAHRHGVVHRDLKPSNVLLVSRRGAGESPLEPVLIDFGIAQGLGLAPVTLPGALVGTAELVTPEYAGKVLDQRMEKPHRATPCEDVFQLGVLLYRMLTARLPTTVPPDTLMELFTEIREIVPVHPLEVNPEAPPAFAELAMTCLEKDGARRPVDAVELERRIGEALERDATLLHRQAPRLSVLKEPRVSEEAEITASGWSANAPEQKTLRALLNGLKALERRMGQTEKELKRTRREARGAARQDRAFVFTVCGLFIVLLALGVALGPFIVRFGDDGPSTWAGQKMPDRPEPQWLRPTDDGKCIFSGLESSSAVILRESCWLYFSKKDPKESCPAPYFDAPPEAPPNLRNGCFQPMMTKAKPPQVVVPDAGAK